MEENREPEINTEAVSEETAESVEADTSSENTSGRNKLLNDILDIVESTLATVFVMIMVFTYLLHPVNVDGDSMKPTLHDKDRILMTTVYGKLEYGDIVIVNNDAVYGIDADGDAVDMAVTNNPLDECIIKRVIAAGGQTINIDNSDSDRSKWTVEVDGKVIDEPYIAENASTSKAGLFDGKFPFTVPEGYYFVMGDNRMNSSDSRSGYVGLIKKEQVYGKALVRYAPLSDFKFLFNSHKESAED